MKLHFLWSGSGTFCVVPRGRWHGRVPGWASPPGPPDQGALPPGLPPGDTPGPLLVEGLPPSPPKLLLLLLLLSYPFHLALRAVPRPRSSLLVYLTLYLVVFMIYGKLCFTLSKFHQRKSIFVVENDFS